MAVSKNLVGSIVNPITDARMKLQMSSNSLARRLGLSRQYLSKAEQGTYTNLNPALLLWTSNALGITRQKVNEQYWNFQAATRKQTKDSIGPHRLVRAIGNNETGSVIFKRWREGYWPSHIAFSSAMCVHPETVKNYEEQIGHTMPFPLKQALFEVDLIDPDWTDSNALPRRKVEEIDPPTATL